LTLNLDILGISGIPHLKKHYGRSAHLWSMPTVALLFPVHFTWIW